MMIYRRFGKTDLQMPVFSLGCMRSMYQWQDMALARIPAASQANLEKLIATALELGITHIETARGYGSSERQLGRILRRFDRHRFILQTKMPPADDPARFLDDFEDSLARLRVDYVDLLAIHGINDHRSFWQACRPGGCLAAARRLQQQGRVRFVGFSGHGDTDIIRTAIRHEQDGGFDYVNIHWYYIFQQNQAALADARERDMGVFIIRPTDKGGMLQKPPDRLRQLCRPLTPMQFNDLFCLSRPEIHTLSIGAGQPADFDDHLNVLPLLEQQDLPLAAIDQRLRQAMHGATGCQRPDALWEQLPCWQDTPGYINLRLIIWLYHLARGWDLLEYARGRYLKLGREMPWVPGMPAEHPERYDFTKAFRNSPLDPQTILSRTRAAHALLGPHHAP